VQVLVLSPFNPVPPYWGGAVRTLGIVESLLRVDGVSVSLVYPSLGQVKNGKYQNLKGYLSPGVDAKRLDAHRIASERRFEQAINPRMLLAALGILKGKKNRLVWCEFTWSGIMGLLVSFLTRSTLVLDEHNIEFIRSRRLGSWMHPLIKITEYILWFMARFIIVVSEHDRESIRIGMLRRKAVVLANGYSSDTFRPDPKARTLVRNRLGLDSRQKMVLFFGKLDYKPNAESLRIIFDKIAPALSVHDVRILIAGAGLASIATLPASCSYVGTVPRIADYINAADAVIVPLQSGGGTRLKIIEALACGVPVISTTIGAEGFPLEELKDLLKTTRDNDWEEFIDSTLFVLNNPPSEIMIRQSLQRIEEFSWKAIGNKLNTVMSSILGGAQQ
jgi:glycosyltransferase involved in cell wall biosynthesis